MPNVNCRSSKRPRRSSKPPSSLYYGVCLSAGSFFVGSLKKRVDPLLPILETTVRQLELVAKRVSMLHGFLTDSMGCGLGEMTRW